MAVAPLSQPGGGAADLSAMLGQLDLGSEEGEDGLMKMMQGMMATLLSRDVLYPSLTDLCKQVHCYSKVVVHMLVQQDPVTLCAFTFNSTQPVQINLALQSRFIRIQFLDCR